MQRLVLFSLLLLPAAPAALLAQDRPQVFVARGPDEGRDAPDFTLPWANKDTVGTDTDAYALWRDRGKVVVLAFYPRDFTRTDSLLLATFRDRYDDMFGADAVVLAVSADPIEMHQRFAAHLGIAFRLLSDPDQAVAAKYGSKDTGGINRRTVYVIGPDGRVRWRDLRFQATDPKAYEALRRAVRAASRG
jgi:thioredoxin-dependent peroxiredoxin